MKRLFFLFAFFGILLNSPFLRADIRDDGDKKTDKVIVEVVEQTNDKLVLRKTDHFKKTMVEIRYSNNDYVGYVKMKRNKLKIDFTKVKPGTYVVVILGKDNHIQEFEFTRK